MPLPRANFHADLQALYASRRTGSASWHGSADDITHVSFSGKLEIPQLVLGSYGLRGKFICRTQHRNKNGIIS
jgi:hypothetical protein